LPSRARGDDRKEPPVPNWCDQTVNPCCCRKRVSYLPPSDPNYPFCFITCNGGI
jgi:hypothetical protein